MLNKHEKSEMAEFVGLSAEGKSPEHQSVLFTLSICFGSSDVTAWGTTAPQFITESGNKRTPPVCHSRLVSGP